MFFNSQPSLDDTMMQDLTDYHLPHALNFTPLTIEVTDGGKANMLMGLTVTTHLHHCTLELVHVPLHIILHCEGAL